MRKTVIIIAGVIIFLAIPLAFFVLQRRTLIGKQFIPWPVKQTSQTPERYSVASDVPGYAITLSDTRFLDHVAENVGIFNPDAVVDPELYQGGARFTHTVSRVALRLVPSVSTLMVGVPGKKELAAMGEYTIDGDTLVLRVSLNPNEVTALISETYRIEDVFLQASLQALSYARGLSEDPKTLGTAFKNIQSGIREYLYGGSMPWPIRITRT